MRNITIIFMKYRKILDVQNYNDLYGWLEWILRSS